MLDFTVARNLLESIRIENESSKWEIRYLALSRFSPEK